MKLIKQTIMALMAVAVAAGFTACSDDNDYEVGKQSPGAYFPNTLSDQVNLDTDAATFTVPVLRTGVETPTSYTVTVSDPSGLFTIPGQVVFEPNSLESNIVISYPTDKIEMGKKYPITITINNGSVYGTTNYSFNAVMNDPLETKPFGPTGTGTYTYVCIWSGDDPDLPVTQTYNPKTPNKNITLTISDWGYGVPFQIVIPDLNSKYSDGTIPVTVPCQFTGYVHDTYGPVWAADYYSYLKDYANNANADSYYGESTYDPEAGYFDLRMIYYIPEYETGSYYLGDVAFEPFQLGGFPSYGVTVSYAGLFTDPNGKMSAVASFTTESDVESVKATMVSGTGQAAEEQALQKILAGEDVTEVAAGENVNASFPLEEGGIYTIVGVSYAKGEAQLYGSCTFKVTVGSADDDYVSIGLADFIDGWVLPGYLKEGYSNEDMAYTVEVKRSKSTPTSYLLVNPYAASPLTDAGYNTNSIAYDVQMTVIGNGMIMEPQECGFATEDDGMFSIGNIEGNNRTNPNLDSWTDEQLIAAVQAQFPTQATIVEDDIIMVPGKGALFGYAAAPGKLYTWNRPQDAYIYLPTAEAAKVKSHKAARVAKPSFRPLSSVVKERKQVKNIFLAVPNTNIAPHKRVRF